MPAIAVLWIDFVREIRWYWEESERLPRMKSSSTIDLSYCLIHQKLQMVHQYFPHVFRANVIYLFICIVAQYTSLMNFKKNTCIIVLLACLCLHWAQPTHALSYALLPCQDGKLWFGPYQPCLHCVLGLYNALNSMAIWMLQCGYHHVFATMLNTTYNAVLELRSSWQKKIGLMQAVVCG